MRVAALAATIAMAALPGMAAAQGAADHFKGKTITIVVGQGAGSGFDIYTRALTRHMARHISGAPVFVVQNMPGASGVNAANWLSNIAPKDGTTLGTWSPNVVLEPLFGNAMAKYDASKFVWLGNMEQSAAVCGVLPSAGVSGLKDLQEKEVVFGATGPTGPLGVSPVALNRLLGTKIKVVLGYKSSPDVKLAMSKGEVSGICGLPYSTIKAFWKDLLDAGQFKTILQLSAKKLPEFGAVEHIDDHVKSPELRQLSDLIFGVQALGRIYAGPQGVPADRVALLRTAFAATLADPEFMADAEKTRIDIIPATGEEVTQMIEGFYKAPPEIIARAKAVMAGE